VENELARERIPMKNAEMNVEGNTLTVKVDLTKRIGPSSSGKTINFLTMRSTGILVP
jgi:hypothetical protein